MSPSLLLPKQFFFVLLIAILAVSFSFSRTSIAQESTTANTESTNFFPSATRFGEPDDELGIIPVYQLNQIIGYIFETDNLTHFPGFSGETVNLEVALDTEGVIRGINIINHHEPIFLYGLGEEPLQNFVRQYLNRRIDQRLLVGSTSMGKDHNTQYVDGITKATVSVMVIHDTILGAAMRVARKKLSGFEAQAEATIKLGFLPMSFDNLVSKQFVQSWKPDNESEYRKLEEELESLRENDAENLFDIQWALINSEQVGTNLLGTGEYERLLNELAPGETAILMLSNGAISFIEPDFASGASPNRLSIYQNGYSVDIRDINFHSFHPETFSEKFPPYRDVMIFRIKANSGFDLSAPFEIRLTLFTSSNPIQTTSLSLGQVVSISADLLDIAAIENMRPTPLWKRLWQQRTPEIIFLGIYLVTLACMFSFQRQLAPRFGRHLSIVRFISLLFTVTFIGFYAQGQLSVVNIYTLLLSLWQGFDIQVFLLDPIIFLLWGFVFISLFLWGRGVFCGWLCPFGALQELVALVAKQLNIRQWIISEKQHRALQCVKYPILVCLVAMAFIDLSMAETLAEIEPFKTAITMNFIRYWPFVVYSLLLLALGMFVYKFYCRYLCPLGAGLAILGRFRLFSWLKRRDECGSPCQLCYKQCEIKAISKIGQVDYNECVQCLECLVIIDDKNRCVTDRYKSKGNRRKQQAIPVKISE
ncbi:4Fe-4S binding protein [Grimontia sp. S25]|uniref:4Fe-4S binding protein n=1 Tax=Grimontia sedimenti TaxID=2711294 RepID=A0A6M1R8E8_9GAMM|nr:4Fe-4S binding protein [Grimontia sedimenti]NGN96754.1 4Fe-4S binding protein [Grimontia sedimenti]